MAPGTLTVEEYRAILDRWLEAWTRADAEAVASFYADTFDYRDPSAPGGIFNRADFIKYLHSMFRLWPSQKWTATGVMPHAHPGFFSAEYEFQIAGGGKTIRGTGMDRVEFTGDRITLNHVYLNAEQWNRWVKKELEQ
jgi:hypothetical protein